jgi:hypothetical protein
MLVNPLTRQTLAENAFISGKALAGGAAGLATGLASYKLGSTLSAKPKPVRKKSIKRPLVVQKSKI